MTHELIEGLGYLFNFAVLATSLYLLGRKPIAQAFSKKSRGVVEQMAELENLLEKSQIACREEQKRLEEIQEEVAHIHTYSQESVEALRREAKAYIETTKVQMEQRAKQKIEQSRKSAVMELKSYLGNAALELAEARFKTLSDKEQEALIGRIVKRLEGVRSESSAGRR